MQLGAGVVGAGQAAGAEADGGHVEVAAVLLDQQVGGRLGGAEQRVQGRVDRHRRVDPAEVLVVLGQLEPRLQLLQRQAVRRVAVDLVGRGEDEGRLGAVLAGRLEQVEGAVGVDPEVGLRVAAPPSRGRAARRCGRPARSRSPCSAKTRSIPSASRMSRSTVRKSSSSRSRRSVTCAVEASGPKSDGAGVVLDPDHVVAGLDQAGGRLGADQAPGSCDYRLRHRFVISPFGYRSKPSAARSESSCAADQSSRSASTSRGPRRGRHEVRECRREQSLR